MYQNKITTKLNRLKMTLSIIISIDDSSNKESKYYL